MTPSHPDNPTTPSGEHSKAGERRRITLPELLRRRFFAGMITIIPALVTVYAVYILVSFIDWIFGPFVEPVVERMMQAWGWNKESVEKYVTPVVSMAMSLLAATAVIVVVGELTRWFLIRKLISIGEMILERIPLVRFFYRTPKEVIKLLTEQRKSVKRVVLVEWPREGVWALAYATSEIQHEPDGQVFVTVFMPSTPNPTTGFLMLVPIEQVRDFNVTTEDSFRMIISGGILSPDLMTTKVFSGMEIQPELPPPAPLTSDGTPVPGIEEEDGEEKQ